MQMVLLWSQEVLTSKHHMRGSFGMMLFHSLEHLITSGKILIVCLRQIILHTHYLWNSGLEGTALLPHTFQWLLLIDDFSFFTGLGSCQEGFQRRLAGVVEALECCPAQGVIIPSPKIVLVTGPDLYPTRQVHHFWHVHLTGSLPHPILCLFLNGPWLIDHCSKSITFSKSIFRDPLSHQQNFHWSSYFPDVTVCSWKAWVRIFTERYSKCFWHKLGTSNALGYISYCSV